MAGIRADCADRRLVPVQRLSIEPLWLEPEGLLDPAPDRLGPLPQRRRPNLVAAGGGDLGQAAVGGEDVALDLDQRHETGNGPAIEVVERVVAVFPALVDDVLPVGGADAILDQPVAVTVAVPLEPGQGAPDVG